MSAPAGSDDADPETVFASLPPPDAFQKDAGWSRDWSRVWAPHEEKLAATRHLQGEELMNAFRSRPDHVSPDGKGRVLFFDVTGGATVRLAKERARCEQIARETQVARDARNACEQERKSQANLPEVMKIQNMPMSMLQNGETIPLVGLGTWKSTEKGEAQRAVDHALNAGYTHIDCASVYENEKEIGDGLQNVFQSTRLNRGDIFLTSKLWNDKHHPNDVEAACRATLSDLRTDYLDLYLMHWPVVTGNTGDVVDPSIESTWKAMERLVDLGLVRSLGVSNFSVTKLEKIKKIARYPLQVCQVECHPYHRNDVLSAYCSDNGIHVTAYSPLGSPDSASMFRGREKVPELLKDNCIGEIAARNGKNVGQVLIKWALQKRPTSSVLPKSANPDRLKGNLELFDWNLSDEDVKTIDQIETRARMVDGSFWLSANGPYRKLEDLWD